ncbi:hypothetical protein EXU30_03965 [Shewanella maritima]|uniref:SnoaL-like domain-containing protein n=1 Tax=Shewanella maritima TaxID=2520507 RepID=A0A411PED5_9GAMM|nr:nuclear transport factor 2 family protein [Shewanella maritima]QBF81947.1 hypothetical protein EXU30_03965 [Shewanella maritima]
MTLSINKLGLIAMLVTTVTAFDCLANDTKVETDDKPLEQTTTSSLTIDTELNTQSEQVSKESAGVITDLNDAIKLNDPQQLDEKDRQLINSLLNQLHESAETADWHLYFSLYHDQAVFIGTDATERWDMKLFRQYAEKTQGWRYELQSRKLIKVGDTVVFDEQLYSESYGVSRGTGAMVWTPQGWKVLQYHLSFPIPNDKAKRITSLIKQ